MSDQDTAYYQATIREQRAEIERLTADRDHLAQVVGQQSARLEEQAREMAALRAAVARVRDEVESWSTDPNKRPAFLTMRERLRQALNGATDE